jgi:hypothetical protein
MSSNKTQIRLVQYSYSYAPWACVNDGETTRIEILPSLYNRWSPVLAVLVGTLIFGVVSYLLLGASIFQALVTGSFVSFAGILLFAACVGVYVQRSYIERQLCKHGPPMVCRSDSITIKPLHGNSTTLPRNGKVLIIQHYVQHTDGKEKLWSYVYCTHSASVPIATIEAGNSYFYKALERLCCESGIAIERLEQSEASGEKKNGRLA